LIGSGWFKKDITNARKGNQRPKAMKIRMNPWESAVKTSLRF